MSVLDRPDRAVQAWATCATAWRLPWSEVHAEVLALALWRAEGSAGLDDLGRRLDQLALGLEAIDERRAATDLGACWAGSDGWVRRVVLAVWCEGTT